ncbi:MAG: histidine phosphatase family protein [bacterium]|nr:histidine phosphatase family protein [bacterium]
MRVVFIRHGMTAGNESKRYVGTTDESLCEKGRILIQQKVLANKYPDIKQLVVSPMKRCVETADIIYPAMQKISYEKLKECDFGEFEYKNYMDLADNPSFQDWIDSEGKLPFPGGESMEQFRARCVEAFLQVIEEAKEEIIGLVVHGGTIMSILSEYCKERDGYFDWMVKNGCGFICEYDTQQKRLYVMEEIND